MNCCKLEFIWIFLHSEFDCNGFLASNWFLRERFFFEPRELIAVLPLIQLFFFHLKKILNFESNWWTLKVCRCSIVYAFICDQLKTKTNMLVFRIMINRNHTGKRCNRADDESISVIRSEHKKKYWTLWYDLEMPPLANNGKFESGKKAGVGCSVNWCFSYYLFRHRRDADTSRRLHRIF